jgi:hypothetical protein
MNKLPVLSIRRIRSLFCYCKAGEITFARFLSFLTLIRRLLSQELH